MTTPIERLRKELACPTTKDTDLAAVRASDLSLVLRAVEAAREYASEMQNSVPDALYRHTLRKRLIDALSALTKEEK